MGELTLIKKAYKFQPDDLNKKDDKLGWAPLYRTVICRHQEATRYLLEKGADPDIKNNLGETPLH